MKQIAIKYCMFWEGKTLFFVKSDSAKKFSQTVGIKRKMYLADVIIHEGKVAKSVLCNGMDNAVFDALYNMKTFSPYEN